jgi:hypothetical protein
MIHQRKKGRNMFCIWADGTWCEREQLELYLKFMSDDFNTTDTCPSDEEIIIK